MYLGKIAEIGPAEEMLTRPAHPYTKALLAVVPEAGGDPTERKILAGEPPDPSRIPPGCRFHPRCPAVASGEAAAAGIEDRCFGEVPPLYGAGPGHGGACHLLDRRP
jgi:peptide/nickel transport system ATP-binding protein